MLSKSTVPTGATPAINDELAFCGTEGGTFFGIDWQAQEVVWSFRDEVRSQPFRSSPAVRDNLVVVGGRARMFTAWTGARAKNCGRLPRRNRSIRHPSSLASVSLLAPEMADSTDWT